MTLKVDEDMLLFKGLKLEDAPLWVSLSEHVFQCRCVPTSQKKCSAVPLGVFFPSKHIALGVNVQDESLLGGGIPPCDRPRGVKNSIYAGRLIDISEFKMLTINGNVGCLWMCKNCKQTLRSRHLYSALFIYFNSSSSFTGDCADHHYKFMLCSQMLKIRAQNLKFLSASGWDPQRNLILTEQLQKCEYLRNQQL